MSGKKDPYFYALMNLTGQQTNRKGRGDLWSLESFEEND